MPYDRQSHAVHQAYNDGFLNALKHARMNPGNVDMMIQQAEKRAEALRAEQAAALGITD